ncbi:MAG: 3-deoxy-D-manno-octulosonic acid transferase [Prevotella sp.]|nr:3-deoxy-D-manno-octulosonic acid transferase [Prevotella sp.]
MYNIIIYAYLLGVAIYSLFNEKVKKMWRGERDAFNVLREKVEPGARYVWFHAASLGEFEQGRPLMEQLKRDHPELKILLTFFSPSGYEVRKDYKGADIICYLPLDTIRNARRFLRLIRPEMAFFIKYEFWYNYLHILKHRKVPTYSVSSIFRDGQVFFRWYGRQYSRVLKCFTHFYVQNEKSRELLAGIGIDCVTVVGDSRFDRVLQIKEAAKQLKVVEDFLEERGKRREERGERREERENSNTKVFVAGSSWPPDEDIFIRYFKEHPDWKLIIAPHVIGEDHLQQIITKFGDRKVVRYTQAEQSPLLSEEQGEALIVDCFGLLSSIYRYATVSYVGGGFGVSIHNTLEAAVWGCPVIFGPENKKFQEAQGLKACGGGFEIKGYDDFAQLMDRFESDEAFLNDAGHKAGAYVESLAGATEKILNDVEL